MAHTKIDFSGRMCTVLSTERANHTHIVKSIVQYSY